MYFFIAREPYTPIMFGFGLGIIGEAPENMELLQQYGNTSDSIWHRWHLSLLVCSLRQAEYRSVRRQWQETGCLHRTPHWICRQSVRNIVIAWCCCSLKYIGVFNTWFTLALSNHIIRVLVPPFKFLWGPRMFFASHYAEHFAQSLRKLAEPVPDRLAFETLMVSRLRSCAVHLETLFVSDPASQHETNLLRIVSLSQPSATFSTRGLSHLSCVEKHVFFPPWESHFPW